MKPKTTSSARPPATRAKKLAAALKRNIARRKAPSEARAISETAAVQARQVGAHD